MAKKQLISVIVGILILGGLVFSVYYWFQNIKPGLKSPASGGEGTEAQEEIPPKRIDEIVPETNYPAGGEKEIFLEPEREGGEKPNIE